VRFAIPGGGPHVIAQRGGPLLPAFVEPVVVDGYSQPGSQPNTIPFGAGGLDTVLRIQVESRLEFEGDGSVLRGIAGTVRLVSDGNAVEGCFLGPTADGTLGDPAAGVIVHGSANRIGGRTAPQRNLISAGLSGVRLLDAGGNVLEGNLIGTTRDGHGPLPNVLCAVDVSSPDNLVGGVAPGAGNVVSGNEGYGVCLSGLSGAPATGNRVQGNWIGLDAEGDDALPNAIGLQIVWPSARDNVVGGAGAGEGNVISGNLHEGVVLRLDAHHNTVEGNLIGPAAVGSGAAGNGWEGVFISGASDNVIRGNEIRRNGFSGISVMFDSTGNVFTRNAISDNAVLGIDLGFDGVTPNDPGDVDTGPHGLLNAPDVTQAAPGQAAGRLNSVPNTTFEIETFASAGPDPTGHGEGARFLGAQSVTTDADGVAVFTVPAAFTAGEWVAATATGPEGTSEFGQGFVAPLVERRELVHGAALTADLAAAPGPVPDRDEYVLAQQPHSSYEVVVDAASGDAAPLVLERVATDGVTVLQAAEPTGTGTSLALRWENTRATPVFAEVIRVRSGGCTTGCGADDVYRIRAYETTSSIARFSNAGEQVTVLFLQNPTDAPARTTAYFWDASGALLARQPFDLAPRSLLTYFVAAGPGLAGRSGSITVSTDAGYGRLAGKTVALEPPSGFSFDSPLLPRPR
jgi:parallel beta-helix repeat protein